MPGRKGPQALSINQKKQPIESSQESSPRTRDISSLVRDTHKLYAKALQSLTIDIGITIGPWLLLRALWEEDGLNQRELSQRVRLYDSATVPWLDSMEQQGLVKRVRNTEDRRKTNIYLTPKGRALEKKLIPLIRKVDDAAENKISPRDIENFYTTLLRIHNNLKEYLAKQQATDS